MTDEQILAVFRANGVLKIPARSLSDPDGLKFMVAIGYEIFRAGMERAAVICEVANTYDEDDPGGSYAAAIRAEAAKTERERG